MVKKFLSKIGVHYIYRKYKLLTRYLQFKREFEILRKTNGERFEVSKKYLYPCLDDNINRNSFDKHYVYHTAWAARKLKEINPKIHVDISSFIYFSTIISAFIPIQYYEYRPVNIELNNLETKHCDITNLPFDDNSIVSLSCMHVVEHIGLGRYGDPLDPDGDLKAINELKRVLAPNGYLIFVVPVGGKSIIMFNAHRIYTYEQVISYFENFELIEFSLIPDQSEEGIILNANNDQANRQIYGCGCFLFKKNREY